MYGGGAGTLTLHCSRSPKYCLSYCFPTELLLSLRDATRSLTGWHPRSRFIPSHEPPIPLHNFQLLSFDFLVSSPSPPRKI